MSSGQNRWSEAINAEDQYDKNEYYISLPIRERYILLPMGAQRQRTKRLISVLLNSSKANFNLLKNWGYYKNYEGDGGDAFSRRKLHHFCSERPNNNGKAICI
jgi:hypothetical protein